MESGLKSHGGVECPICHAFHLPRTDRISNGAYATTCENCGHFFKFRVSSGLKSNIQLKVNGKQYTVGSEFSGTSSLNGFLRDSRISTGTKYMCYEGGCGTCVVQAKLYEPITGERKSYAINSCLCPLFLCDGWEITTVEGIDDSGPKSVPQRLAKYNGSQCGFCSPGQVMNMYSLLDFHGGSVTQKEVEDAFDAVICRCTGYRSILAAMKSFAVETKKNGCTGDIEDLGKICKKTGERCQGRCGPKVDPSRVILQDAQWLRPTTVDELVKVMDENKGKNYKLVFGNTGFGVFKEIGQWMYDVLIDIRGVKEMYGIDFDPTTVLGANLSLTQLQDLFYRSQNEPQFLYFKEMYKIVSSVATQSVRNLGSWAGNLMLKHKHPEFQSDIFTMLQAVSALLEIADVNSSSQHTMDEFLSMDMTGKVIVAMVLTGVTNDHQIRIYKVHKRAQNAYSEVNGGIQMCLDKNYVVTKKPVIVFGGIAKTFSHAAKTEEYLTGKTLSDPQVFTGAITTLSGEIIPDESDPLLTSASFRKTVALSLFYRYVLDVLGDKAGAIYRSGATPLERPLSSGQQSYDTQPIEWPLTEPLTKIEAVNQASGKAIYINDIPPQPGELGAAFVLSTVGNAKIQSIDPTEALSMPGVIKFLSAKDIPAGGVNNYMPEPLLAEEVFCSETVDHCGQAIGLIVAEGQQTAESAAGKVKVTYSDVQPPILGLEEAIEKKSFFPNGDPSTDGEVKVGDAEGAILKAPIKIMGRISMGHQYHFHMETQISICVPTEDGFDVDTSTQWIDFCQRGIAKVLGIPDSKINVRVKRLGGAYGGKISRNFRIAAACALAANATKRPVRLDLNFHTNMKMIGKRVPWLGDYTVGVTEDGRLLGVKVTYYADCGNSPNENPIPSDIIGLENAYFCENWHFVPVAVKTNTPMNTACRSPTSCPTIFIMESIMEHVARVLKMNPTQFKTINLYQQGQITPSKFPLKYCNIRGLMSQLLESAEVTRRQKEVDAFNQANRWKKRGMSVVPMKFGIGWDTANYSALVAIHGLDGSVSISHGGIECGQGINTKVAQVCAYMFGIPMDTISVKASNSLASANSVTTGGSITSELCCKAVMECCTALKARIEPVRTKMSTSASWKDIISKCYADSVDLSARFWNAPKTEYDLAYNSYGVTCTEVTLDILTGQHVIDRVDMLFDCGESMNPALDIGQAEGAFVMGLGYWLTEELKFDSETGNLLTDGTWEYKVPLGKDIPVDFRIQLLKKAPNPLGILRAKASGEPPLCMSCSALFAIKHAIEAYRHDNGDDNYFPFNAPATVEKVQQACRVDPNKFLF